MTNNKILILVKSLNKHVRRYINGWKGAVSILLALITAPFLSITLLIVESARYQSTVELMEEIIDSSAFSVLAEYDTYLEERFGVMAVSQNKDVLSSPNGTSVGTGGPEKTISGYLNNRFFEYLTDNSKNIGADIKTGNVEGQFALSDPAILEQQIFENSEISAATEMFINGFDVDVLMEKFNGAFKSLEKLSKQAEATSATAAVANDIADIINNIKDTIAIYNGNNDDDNLSYEEIYKVYMNRYTDFEDEAKKLIDALNDFEKNNSDESDENGENTESESEEKSPYDDEKVKNAMKDCDKAAQEYKTAASKFKDKFSLLKKNLDSIQSKILGLPAKINTMDSKIASSAESESSDSEEAKAVAGSGLADSSAEWYRTIAEEAGTRLKIVVDMNFTANSQDVLNKLESQIVILERFSAKEDIKPENPQPESPLKDEYKPVDASVIPLNLPDALNSVISALNDKVTSTEDTASAIDELLTFMKQIISVSFLYDANLNSVVSEDSFFQADTGVDVGDLLFGESISKLISAGEDVVNSIRKVLAGDIFAIVDLITAAAKILVAIAEFITSLIAKVVIMSTSILEVIGTLFTDPGEIWNRLLLYSYAAYNLPNRTNYNSGKSLSGYSYNKIYTAAGGTSKGITVFGGFQDVSTFGDSYGSDNMFKGAEGEYMLVGTANEKKNQAITAYDLFLFRIILNIGPVLLNSTVSSTAAPAGPFAPLVYIAYIIGESAIDTLFLVNGVSVYFFKKAEYIYLSPRGIKNIITDGLSMTGLSKSLQKEITKDSNEKKNDDKELQGYFDGDYKEYLIMLMLLNGCSINKYLSRLQNLIQLEAADNYKNNRKYDYDFDLNNTYTYIRTDVDYEIKMAIDFNSLTAEKGLLNAKVSKYHGY